MPVNTVQGIINKDQLGVVLPHEHIFIDLSNQFREFNEATKKAFSEKKITLENYGVLRRNPWAIKDNLIINDFETAKEEVLTYRLAGGDTIVDVSNIGLGRDVEALQKISRCTGVNIVASCSYYYHDTHPEDMADKTVGDLQDEIIKELTEGIGHTDIKAGMIGEIGISEEMHPDEEKVLAASALAQKETGAGMQVHIFPWNSKGKWPIGLQALDILKKNGAIIEKVAVNHVGVAIDIKLDYIKEIISRGAFVIFDNFGHDFYVEKKDRLFVPGPFATDVQRVQAIKNLIDEGFLSQILISNDICHKTLLHKYGGWGYDHAITNIPAMMDDFGITKKQINTILVNNPARLLDMAV